MRIRSVITMILLALMRGVCLLLLVGTLELLSLAREELPLEQIAIVPMDENVNFSFVLPKDKPTFRTITMRPVEADYDAEKITRDFLLKARVYVQKDGDVPSRADITIQVNRDDPHLGSSRGRYVAASISRYKGSNVIHIEGPSSSVKGSWEFALSWDQDKVMVWEFLRRKRWWIYAAIIVEVLIIVLPIEAMAKRTQRSLQRLNPN